MANDQVKNVSKNGSKKDKNVMQPTTQCQKKLPDATLHCTQVYFHSIVWTQINQNLYLARKLQAGKKIELKFNNCTQLMQQLQIEPDTFLFFFCYDLLNHAKNRSKNTC